MHRLVATRALRHVRLFARDLPRLRAFYETTLGLAVRSATATSVRFDAGGVDLVLPADPPSGDPSYRDSINQLKGNMRGTGTAIHFEVDDLDGFFGALQAAGVAIMDP